MKQREIRRLSNGLGVVFVPFDGIDSVNVVVLGNAGSNYEKEQEIGGAHFLEHVCFEGSTKYPSQKQLAEIIVNTGGESNGTTSPATVRYYTKTLKENLEESLDYLSQVTFYPIIDEKEITKHKEIIKQEILKKLDNPVQKFWIDSKVNFFHPNHRLYKMSSGDVEDVNKITRDTLAQFHDRCYGVENFVIGVCGNVDNEKVFDLAEKYFGSVKHCQENVPVVMEKIPGVGFFTQNKDVKQSIIEMEYYGYLYSDQRRYSEYMLDGILGTSELSRLFYKIRVLNGLAYSTGSGCSAEDEYGHFYLSANINEKNLTKVANIMIEEIQDLKTNLVSDEEFNRTKNMVISSFAFGEENPGRVASFYANKLLAKEEDVTKETVLERYKAVTKKDVYEAANEIFGGDPKINVLSTSLTLDQVKQAFSKIL